MTKRMLIDATHAEETRVVVMDGNRLEDFDVETSTKRQLKGNIYLAKVVRVEPSLQAAFVEYGGGRHGFLAFGEIHPDYYQIPVADRQRLLEMQAEEARREEEEDDRAAAAEESGEASSINVREIQISFAEPETIEHNRSADSSGTEDEPYPKKVDAHDHDQRPSSEGNVAEVATADPAAPEPTLPDAPDAPITTAPTTEREQPSLRALPSAIRHDYIGDTTVALGGSDAPHRESDFAAVADTHVTENEPDETDNAHTEDDAMPSPTGHARAGREAGPNPDAAALGEQDQLAESSEDARESRIPPRFLRNYKIQEVIKRRQILLIQVVKEERGTKGAALTTYISLAGRFCVLMPNSPRGGGISRKITSAADRRRLKEITAELSIPKGMGLIVRTAGAQRPKPEITRDCEYLMRLWDEIREHTMRSVAPALIYEEASLIKRAIRDVYSRDLDDILVDGDDGWRAAHDFMRMLMPAHAKKVQLWRDPNGQPLFARHQVDVQLDAMMNPTVQLKSGGYLVINQTEALVAVDVNSGRSTRERGIEETALRTNLEAADEVARQLRLRDLAGLIVIDFIDMEAKKHNAMVERRLKDALKNDRARIQVGQISHFGLLEMSRQRLRPSLAETSFVTCQHCGGLGHVRSTESAAIQVLRAIEEEGARRRSAEIVVYAASSIALYVLNHKRDRLLGIESRYGMHVTFASDESLLPPIIRIERARPLLAVEGPAIITQDAWKTLQNTGLVEAEVENDEAADISEEMSADRTETVDETATAADPNLDDGEQARRKRRRRRRGGRREDGTADSISLQGGEPAGPASSDEPETGTQAGEIAAADEIAPTAAPSGSDEIPGTEDEESLRRRRGRRGGRRRRRDEETSAAISEPGAEQPDLLPTYSGPTPANPFGGHGYDIFDVLEQAEERAASAAQVPLAIVSTSKAAVDSTEEVPLRSTVAEELATADKTATPVEPAMPHELEALAESAIAESSLDEAAAAGAVDFQPGAPDAERADVAVVPIAEASNSAEANEQLSSERTAAPEPVIGTVIQPVVIGEVPVPMAEKKRGWWRR